MSKGLFTLFDLFGHLLVSLEINNLDQLLKRLPFLLDSLLKLKESLLLKVYSGPFLLRLPFFFGCVDLTQL